MYFKYNCNGKVINVFRYMSNEFNKTVEVDSGKKSFIRSLHKDDKGEFFTWNKQKIYVNNWIRMSMSELKNHIEKNDIHLMSDDLCIGIMTDKPENVRLRVPSNLLMCNNSKDTVICHIEEGFNREVSHNYKLRLVHIMDNGVKRYHDTYTSDLFSLIRSNIVTIEDSVK